jgi:3,4-dihydroxy-2-butanone 4-phosphate synthase
MFSDGFDSLEILGVATGLNASLDAPIFTSIDEAVAELRAGRMIVIVDDEDRENEGDLMIAAEMITPEAINYMATRARGLICLAITSERADALELSPMVYEILRTAAQRLRYRSTRRGAESPRGCRHTTVRKRCSRRWTQQRAPKTWRGRGTFFRFVLVRMAFWSGEVTRKRRSISLVWLG